MGSQKCDEFGSDHLGIDDLPCQDLRAYTKLVEHLEHLKLFIVNMPTESRLNGPRSGVSP